MQWLDAIVQVLPPLTALVFVAGSLWWGRQVVQAKKEALAAKAEQIHAKEAEIAFLERLTPARMVEHLQALNASYEMLLNRAREDAQHRLDEIEQVVGEERSQAQAQLEAGERRIEELEVRVATSETALKDAERLAASWQHIRYTLSHEFAHGRFRLEDVWTTLLETLRPQTRAYFREAKPELEGNRLVLSFPYSFHHKRACASVEEVEPLVQSLFGDDITLELRLVSSVQRYREGDQVEHPQFGHGVVLKSRLTSNDEEVMVGFDEAGVKL